MAALSTIELARKLLELLEAPQSQGSLESQAEDCYPIVEALGYYDLADHLRKIAGVPVFPKYE